MKLIGKVKTLLKTVNGNGNAVRDLLRHDHEEALQIARELAGSSSAAVRRKLFGKLKPALAAHSRAEERLQKRASPRMRARRPELQTGDADGRNSGRTVRRS